MVAWASGRGGKTMFERVTGRLKEVVVTGEYLMSCSEFHRTVSNRNVCGPNLWL